MIRVNSYIIDVLGLRTWLAICLLPWACAISQDSLLLEAPMAKQPLLLPLMVNVNSKEVLFFLDTGSGVSMITKDCALSSAVKETSQRYNLTGTNGQSSQSTGYEVEKFAIGRRIILNHPLAEMPQSALGVLTGVDCSGVIGIRSIKQSIIELDHDAAKLRVWDDLPETGKSFYDEPINYTDIPLLSLEIEGIKGEWAIDTGKDDCVSVSKAVFEKLFASGAIIEKPGGGKAVGVDGVKPTRQGWFLKGELLGKKLRGMEVSETAGIPTLGLNFWFAFHLFIDLIDHKLRYKLRDHPIVPISIQHMLGAVLIYDQTGAVVYKLKPGGGAVQSAGLAEGDKILEIGGLTRPALSLFNLTELCMASGDKALKVKVIRSKDGTTFETVLQLGDIVSSWDFAGAENVPKP